MAVIIHHSVGEKGKNNHADVRLVQRLLNDYIDDPTRLLKVDGIVGPKTLAAIRDFQTNATGVVDGRVDPNGPAIKKLAELHFRKVLASLNAQASYVLSQQCSSLAGMPIPPFVTEYWQLLRKA
jgi:peptidoglycan hydrolase-like protein with peptidoglycan-binding domain